MLYPVIIFSVFLFSAHSVFPHICPSAALLSSYTSFRRVVKTWIFTLAFGKGEWDTLLHSIGLSCINHYFSFIGFIVTCLLVVSHPELLEIRQNVSLIHYLDNMWNYDDYFFSWWGCLYATRSSQEPRMLKCISRVYVRIQAVWYFVLGRWKFCQMHLIFVGMATNVLISSGLMSSLCHSLSNLTVGLWCFVILSNFLSSVVLHYCRISYSRFLLFNHS